MLSLNNPQNSLELANVDVAAEVAEGAALGSARCVVDNDDEACKSSFWGAEKPKRKKMMLELARQRISSNGILLCNISEHKYKKVCVVFICHIID